MQKLTINIIGAGAIGHLWYAYLKQAGINVCLYSKKVKAEKAFILKSPLNQIKPETVNVKYYSLKQWQTCDLILVCVKAFQLESLCQSLAPLVKKQAASCNPPPIILMMNGMGLVEITQKYLPQIPVFHAYLTHGAYLTDTKIIHAGLGKTIIGNIKQTNVSQVKKELPFLNKALPPFSWKNNHYERLIEKLVINSVINPLTALSGKTNSSILINATLSKEAEAVLMELWPIITQIAPRLSLQKTKQSIEQVALSTANNRSSMLQDVINNKPTEIDFINGYFINLGKQYNLALPINQGLVEQIKSRANLLN